MKNEFCYEIQKHEDLPSPRLETGLCWCFWSSILKSIYPQHHESCICSYWPVSLQSKCQQQEVDETKPGTLIKGILPSTTTKPGSCNHIHHGISPPTDFELSPTHFTPLPHSNTIVSTPITPSHRWPQSDSTISTSLASPETPSKQLWLMYGALASTSSGSLLTHLMLTYPIHPPVLKAIPTLLPWPDFSLLHLWASTSYESQASMDSQVQELARALSCMQDIIRAQQLIDESKLAQLVIQHIELAKLKQSV